MRPRDVADRARPEGDLARQRRRVGKEVARALDELGNFGVEDDFHDITYTVDETLTLETPALDATDVSEADDEKLGLPEGLPVIRFNPDGFFDESSVRRVTLRQGTENALEVAQTANHLGYEIRPVTNLD